MVLRIGLLECEDLGAYLSPTLFARFGGYFRMACDVFDHVCALPPSELARHGVSAPLLPHGSVRVEFEVRSPRIACVTTSCAKFSNPFGT